jgi:hypothetical protein
MLIETEEVVMLGENEDLAATLMGGIWISFKDTIPVPQAKILVDAFNLILISDPAQSNYQVDPEEDEGPDGNSSLLPNIITEILVDDATSVPTKKLAIYELITDNIIAVLTRMGFVLNDDELTHERLPELTKLGNFFYEMDSYEDLIGLADTLDSSDIAPADRFLLVMRKYLGDEADLGVYELLIQDVSEVTIQAIRDNLKQGDVEESIPEFLVKRIRANRVLMENTQAYFHVTHNGRIGGTVESFLNFFARQFEVYLDNPTPDNMIAYAKEVTAIYLISEINTPRLFEELSKFLATIVTDHLALVSVEQHLAKLVLDND